MKNILFVGSFCLGLSVWGQAPLQRLDQYIDSIEFYKDGMGSVAFMENGKITYQTSFGYAEMSPMVKNDKKTKFRIGSISKTFTAVAFMQMVEEKKVDLNTPLSRYFSQIPNSENITMEHLLQHRSGLANFLEMPEYQAFMHLPQSKEEMLKRFETIPIQFEPGTQFEYSNTGYVLLAYVLEAIDGVDYATIMKKRITKPLKLKRTYHDLTIEPKNKEAKSFYFSGDYLPATQTHGSIAVGGGSMVSTAIDLVRFMHALTIGKLVSKTSFEQMKTWKDDYGFALFPMPIDSLEGFGHTGGIDGFQSILVHFPEKNLSIAYLSNGVRLSRNEITADLLDLYLGNKTELPSFFQRHAPISKEEVEAFFGQYESKELPLEIQLFWQGDQFMAQASGQSAFSLTKIEEKVFGFTAAGIVIKFTESGFTLIQGGQKFNYTRK